MDKNTKKFVHGIVAFIFAFAYLVFVSPIFAGLGMYSIIITQLSLAALALIYAFIIKSDFKKTFPLKLPSVRHFFGAVFTYAGIYMLTISVTLLMMLLFPSMIDTVEGLSTLTGLMPHPIAAIIVIALMPAICEELLMRGFILHSFSGFKNIAVIIVIGVMFGILHFDPFRFVPTAILGMASAYIVLKTESLVLPMLYHLVNNTFSVIAMYQLNNTNTLDIAAELADGVYFGSVFIYLAIAAVLGYIGLKLLGKKRENQIVTLIVVCIAIALFITGIVITLSYMDLSQFSDIDISEYFP